MDDSPTDFTEFAGNVVFPRSIAALKDTTVCPACQNVLTDVVCGVCGLNLTNPAAKELALVSIGAARLLSRRVGLIGRIRHASAEQAASAAAEREKEERRDTVPAAPALAKYIVTPDTSRDNDAFTGLLASAPAINPEPSTPLSDPAAPRRSSVQVTILVVAAALLSLAAIYFLIYAFVTYGIGVRSAIIGAVTVAAYVTSSVVRRRGLTSTAEAIGAVAIVLTYLDVYAARANNLAGLGDANFSAYWGWALLASAIGFALWGRLSAVRVPSITAFVVFPIAIGWLVNAVPVAASSDLAGFPSFIAVALAGLVHPLAPRLRPAASTSPTAFAERAWMLTISGLSLFSAIVASIFVYSDNDYGWAIMFAVVAAVGLAHLVVALRTMDAPTDPSWVLLRTTYTVAAVFAAVPFALLGAVVAARIDNASFSLIAPLAVAALVTLGIAAARRRATGSRYERAVNIGAMSSLIVTVLTAIYPFGRAVYTTVITVARPLGFSVDGYPATPGVVATPTPEAISAVIALAVALLLVAVYLRITHGLRATSVRLAWAAGLLLLLAVPLLGSVAGVTLGWLVLATAALAGVLLVRPGAALSLRLRWPLLSVAAGSLVLGYAVSWATTGTWWWASIVVVILLMAGRRAVSAGSTIIRSSLLAASLIAALVGAGVLSTPWAGVFGDTSANDALLTNEFRSVGILATILFALAGLPRLSDPTNPRALSFSTLDRRVTFWIAGVTALGSIVAAEEAKEVINPSGLVFAEPGATIVLCLALLASLFLWILPVAAERLSPERAAAALVVAPLTAMSFNAILMATDVSIDALVTLTALPSLLVAAVSLAFAVALPYRVPRWALDLGAGIMILPVISSAITTGFAIGLTPGWTQLLLISATVLLFSVSRDGLFASTSRRKLLGWLALALATASLWAALATAGEGRYLSSPLMPVEAYVLPLTGSLLIIAALMWRTSVRAAAKPSGTASTGLLARAGAAPIVVFLALLISIIPVAIAGASGTPDRAIIIGAISAAALLMPLWLPSPVAVRPFTFTVAAAGAVGVAVSVVARVVGTSDWSYGIEAPYLDLWVGAGALVFIAAAFGWARLSTEPRRILPSRTVVIATLVGAVLLEIQGMFSPELGLARVLTIVTAGAVLHVLGYGLNRPPIDALVAQCAIVIAAVVAVFALTLDTLDQVEQVSVPLAVGLLGAGGIRLARTPALRSWTSVGLGTAVLLIPSLIATWAEPEIWRLVGLGVVAIGVLVVGLVLRLQAPFVLGTVVVLIHAIGTFRYEIRTVYENVPFWWWLAIGGLLLLLLGARYERRVQNFKSVVLKVGSLR